MFGKTLEGKNRIIRRRICAGLLAVICLLPILGVPAIAAAEDRDSIYIDPVPPTPPAPENPPIGPLPDPGELHQVFPDVRPGDWYFEDIGRLEAVGVLNGYPDGNFYPDREITCAEFVKILMISSGVDLSERPARILFPGNWASMPISLAYQKGYLSDEDLAAGFRPDAYITRSTMTRMMILALGIEPARIDDPFEDISDIYASTAYNEYLLRGYLNEDDTRYYNGGSNASRGEAAAIAVRIIQYRENAYEYKKNAILQNASVNALNNEFELLDLFYILNREFIGEFTFETRIPIDTWIEYYHHSNAIHLEYFYSARFNVYHFPSRNVCRVVFEYDEDVETLKKYHAEAEDRADRILAAILHEDMTDSDKIKAIHDYLILNCSYDYTSYMTDTVPYTSRIAWGVLCRKSAVCQGYCAAFNLLCQKAGIRSAVVTGTAPGSTEPHAWNMVMVDGRILYIDVTHDDPVPDQKGKISYRYYCLTESEMTALGYIWDRNHSNLKYFY